MPDITMCEGGECPYRDGCHRYKVTPSEYLQSYFIEPPYKDGKCEYYWGTNQEALWNQLKSIANGKEK